MLHNVEGQCKPRRAEDIRRVSGPATGSRVVAVWLLATVAEAASPSAIYRDAIERYRRGDRYVASEAAWTDRVSDEIAGLKRLSPEGFPFEAAAMLHTDRDIHERDAAGEAEEVAPDTAPHLDAARQIVSLMPDDERRRAFERPWFLAVALHLYRRGQWPLALRYLDAALRRYADDPLLLLARGSLIESQAALDLPSAIADASVMTPQRPAVVFNRRAALQARLRDAEATYRRALSVMPDLVEARVRLGRVLHQRGDHRQAAEELTVAAAHPQADRPTRYLAWLFLGAAREGENRPRQAVEAYRAAAALDPESQVAAVALSHALHQAGERGAAQDVLRAALSSARRRSDWEAWWNYRWGRSHEAERRLEALRERAMR
jgi:tetratricopeptide (TPR) repeat protein